MAIILDTYNILQVTGVLPPHLAGIDVPELIDLISDSRYAQREVCLVCDGSPHIESPSESTGNIHIVYAGAGKSADDLIASMVNRSSDPRRLTVITLDRALTAAVTRHGCRVIRSDAFLSRLAHDQHRADRRAQRLRRHNAARRTVAPLSKGEVDAWLRIFGLSDRPPHYDDTALAEAEEIDMDDLIDEANGA